MEDRIKKELKSIIGNGFSVIYLIAQKLVLKSNQDGYLVGSRGSVGFVSSCDINRNYRSESISPTLSLSSMSIIRILDDGSVGSGFDLPEKKLSKM